MKEAEIEAGLEARLRDERIAACRKLAAAADDVIAAPEKAADLREAYTEISLLAGSDALALAALLVLTSHTTAEKFTRKIEEEGEAVSEHRAKTYVRALNRANDARDRFMHLAREELGVKGRSEGFKALKDLTPEDDFPAPET